MILLSSIMAAMTEIMGTIPTDSCNSEHDMGYLKLSFSCTVLASNSCDLNWLKLVNRRKREGEKRESERGREQSKRSAAEKEILNLAPKCSSNQSIIRGSGMPGRAQRKTWILGMMDRSAV